MILVAVDTLRADHLSCYGGPVATPNLCSLAEHHRRLEVYGRMAGYPD